MKLVYLGSPADAVPPLRALVEAGHDVALVVTRPDARRGRGGAESGSPVKIAALELGLPVVTPAHSSDAIAELEASGATLGVVVAYGQILRPAFLAALPEGFVNLHFSLLPRWRGAAPVERAILAGDTETGVCLMAVEEGLDTGGVFASVRIPITDDDSAGELRARLVATGTQLLVDHIDSVPGRAPEPQAGEPTYAEKLAVEEFEIDPSRPAAELARVVRAGNPRPGAWCTVGGRRVKVWRAQAHAPRTVEATRMTLSELGTLAKHSERARLKTADGVLDLVEVQPEGKRAMSGADFLAGTPRDRRRLDPR